VAEPLRLVGKPGDWRGAATLSGCGAYRYHLYRQIGRTDPLRRVLFVLLNPSTADSSEDDPTIRKCRGFTERWGFERFDVASLFAWRSTDASELLRAQRRGVDILGPDNNLWLAQLARRASRIVVGWGAHAKPWVPYTRTVCGLLLENSRTWSLSCLGTTAAGLPCHPLMLAYSTELVSFTAVRNG